jgi:hypothetical protein
VLEPGYVTEVYVPEVATTNDVARDGEEAIVLDHMAEDDEDDDGDYDYEEGLFGLDDSDSDNDWDD